MKQSLGTKLFTCSYTAVSADEFLQFIPGSEHDGLGGRSQLQGLHGGREEEDLPSDRGAETLQSCFYCSFLPAPRRASPGASWLKRSRDLSTHPYRIAKNLQCVNGPLVPPSLIFSRAE